MIITVEGFPGEGVLVAGVWVDLGPRPTWPTHAEIEMLVGKAVMEALDPNWNDS